ncbi:MAG: PP2C family protein-serine/threonine phosphatase [Candidatus Gracilibacteria bacterium]|nr:PP2C family protein-serine/threonine phosphatase [Candidatus Gracilibacteria bacterium]
MFLFKKIDNPEKITNLKDAIYYIENLLKKSEYIDAMLATKELNLKNSIVITYNENLSKKLNLLMTSNVKEVEIKSKRKLNQVNKILNRAYKRSYIINKTSKKIQDIQEKNLKIKKEDEEKEKFNYIIEEIKLLVKSNDLNKGLALATRLVSEYPNSKKPLETLKNLEKIYEKETRKKQKNDNLEKDLEKTLKEIGIEKEDLEKKALLKISFLNKINSFFSNRKNTQYKKKNQQVLKNLEKILIKSGTIDNILEDVVNQNNMGESISNKLFKDLKEFEILGFDFIGKILSKDKITGDTFGFSKIKNKTIFYIGDSTGHGLKAGFTVSILSKLFFEYSSKIKDFQELFAKINNEFKEKINGKAFVSGIFFEFDDTKTNKFSFIGAGHNPMLLYRKNTGIVEKIIPGGLILGFRNISNIVSVRVKDINMEEGDILLVYTDGIVEIKNQNNEFYGLKRLQENFEKIARGNPDIPINKLFEKIIEKVSEFSAGENYNDDVSVFLFARNKQKDKLSSIDEIEAIRKEFDIKNNKKTNYYKNKTRQEVMEELKKEKHTKDLKIRLERLERLYRIGEFIKLKQEINIYVKEGYVHPKMLFFLKIALENEHKVVIRKWEEKLKNKHDLLVQLYKKGEYEIIIREIIDLLYRKGKF